MFSGSRLQELREHKGWSQAFIAQAIGISRASYFNWEKGKTQPNQKHRHHLCQLLQVSEADLEDRPAIVAVYLQLNADNQEKVLTYSHHLLAKQRQVDRIHPAPLYPYQVYEKLSAGTGIGYFGDGNYDTVFWTEALDHDFSSWIYGDSMEPLYLNGEVALIKQTGFDYDGAIYAVAWDGQTYIKKVFREADGLRLVSINRKYADKFAPYSEEPRIIGKIVGHFRPIQD